MLSMFRIHLVVRFIFFFFPSLSPCNIFHIATLQTIKCTLLQYTQYHTSFSFFSFRYFSFSSFYSIMWNIKTVRDSCVCAHKIFFYFILFVSFIYIRKRLDIGIYIVFHQFISTIYTVNGCLCRQKKKKLLHILERLLSEDYSQNRMSIEFDPLIYQLIKFRLVEDSVSGIAELIEIRIDSILLKKLCQQCLCIK